MLPRVREYHLGSTEILERNGFFLPARGEIMPRAQDEGPAGHGQKYSEDDLPYRGGNKASRLNQGQKRKVRAGVSGEVAKREPRRELLEKNQNGVESAPGGERDDQKRSDGWHRPLLRCEAREAAPQDEDRGPQASDRHMSERKIHEERGKGLEGKLQFFP